MSFSVRLGQDDVGPAAWITTPLDLLPGTPMSPLQRSAAVADLTFALCQQALLKAQGQGRDAWGPPSINVDTTLYWERPPLGDWFGFRPALVTQQQLLLAPLDSTRLSSLLARPRSAQRQ